MDQTQHIESETLRFRVILARRVLTLLSSQELKGIAISMIESGYDCPELHELAWEPVISHSEAIYLFEKAASTLGFSVPSREETAQLLIYYHIHRIAQGQCSLEEGLERLIRDTDWIELSDHSASRYANEAFGLQHLIGAYWGYDDLRDSPDVVSYKGLYREEAKRAYDVHVQGLAAEWLLERPLPTLAESARPSGT